MIWKPKYPPGTYDPRAPRPHVRGPRPHTWVTGPDPEEHRKYRVFIQQKNQAQWRGEGWDITFDQWKQLWDQSGQWHNRGRSRDCYCMTRRNVELTWTPDNVMIITREEHSRIQSAMAHAGYRSPAQIRRRLKLGLPLDKRKTRKKSDDE
ncbi:hypothetical protein UFOVP849_8 [uncultured Caudovirales phage]|uniref:Uncharacterized protein n=1 Tax=uncultured Caudovirales phage TaxID=2100421 RepID=A0A6J5P7H5_9CAUD|nr:hypothetical protein UFOVP849_8 [uncultured Caudovirales phage]